MMIGVMMQIQLQEALPFCTECLSRRLCTCTCVDNFNLTCQKYNMKLIPLITGGIDNLLQSRSLLSINGSRISSTFMYLQSHSNAVFEGRR